MMLLDLPPAADRGCKDLGLRVRRLGASDSNAEPRCLGSYLAESLLLCWIGNCLTILWPCCRQSCVS